MYTIRLCQADLVSWTTLIRACSEHGRPFDRLTLSHQTQLLTNHYFSTMMVGIPLILLGLAHSIQSTYSFTSSPIYTVSPKVVSSLDMIRNRGLERREEGASPMRKFCQQNLWLL